MRKYAKEIMLVLITMIVTSVINVFATMSFSADEISFEPNDTNWNVSSTNSALNDLYSYANSGDATASNILIGKTALVNGQLITGTMADNGAVTSALNAGGSYTIPAGYHNGSGKITANTLASQTSATATAANILTGQTAWVNGSKITGTMTNRGAVSTTINPGGSYTIPAGYHNGSGTVTANASGIGSSLTYLTSNGTNGNADGVSRSASYTTTAAGYYIGMCVAGGQNISCSASGLTSYGCNSSSFTTSCSFGAYLNAGVTISVTGTYSQAWGSGSVNVSLYKLN